MAITPPSWAKDATPTANGWVSPNGELLKSTKISEADIAAFNGGSSMLTEVPNYEFTPEIQPEPQMLHEAPMGEKDINDMSKIELEAYGRTMGIELDRRKSKADLLEEIQEEIDLNSQLQIRV